VGAKVTTILYAGKTHTDLLLQDPMQGGVDDLLADILAVIHKGDDEAKAEDFMVMKRRRRLVPEIFLQLAHRVCPF